MLAVVMPLMMVFICCSLNVVIMEMMIRSVPTCSQMITFSQFLFVALEGLAYHIRKWEWPAVPLRHYCGMVVMFWSSSLINNAVLGFGISMPLHMVFRAGSLASNMLLGMVLFGKRYSMIKYTSVFLVTVGILNAMWATVHDKMHHDDNDIHAQRKHNSDMKTWLFGVGMLVLGLILSSSLGLYQEKVTNKFRNEPRESLFYMHFLSLPAFVICYRDIAEHAVLFTNSLTVAEVAPFATNIFPFVDGIPSLWVLLLANVILQYGCLRGVFWLTTITSSLHVTLALTLRKFLSLVTSVYWFGNRFTAMHWAGAVMVFGGSVLFFTNGNGSIKYSASSSSIITSIVTIIAVMIGLLRYYFYELF